LASVCLYVSRISRKLWRNSDDIFGWVGCLIDYSLITPVDITGDRVRDADTGIF